jgi:hypothetical protein
MVVLGWWLDGWVAGISFSPVPHVINNPEKWLEYDQEISYSLY